MRIVRLIFLHRSVQAVIADRSLNRCISQTNETDHTFAPRRSLSPFSRMDDKHNLRRRTRLPQISGPNAHRKTGRTSAFSGSSPSLEIVRTTSAIIDSATLARERSTKQIFRPSNSPADCESAANHQQSIHPCPFFCRTFSFFASQSC